MSSLSAPLCPAGHLPHKEGDWQLRRSVHASSASDWQNPRWSLISPLVGEMPGRAEGGAS
ncbi:hypothetical protein FJV76_26125 [Mesorhizobium sp. WSM4303]|nr:hypothetical protein FJV77_14380 [Mesorhizobium sp. WSM4306]TRC98209.1 hypothetical protein FJV76_26125 [Mesorhizobium sp. WSM4303]